MGTRIDDQTTEKASLSTGAEVTSVGSGVDGHGTGVGDGGDWCALVDQGRTLITVGTGQPQVCRLDFQIEVEGLVVTGEGSARAGSRGSGSGRNGDRLESLSQDPEKGKSTAVLEEAPKKRSVERVEFNPPVGSSRHDPISSSDLAEFVGGVIQT
ncbi:hypothetical protein RHMOL_Rhmol11G0052700 [Rhododendron molle]|uniref:Uncharacterized protein n=1 Tax=Rhododendron molle TaxID=49168 RepID=A0ACC0LP25_RHOML|nr:hypothetical protein RHMOL_Rhmol11G0052700 [Rhododendron molle]